MAPRNRRAALSAAGLVVLLLATVRAARDNSKADDDNSKRGEDRKSTSLAVTILQAANVSVPDNSTVFAPTNKVCAARVQGGGVAARADPGRHCVAESCCMRLPIRADHRRLKSWPSP
jgi:hypothetical protein